MPTLPPIIASPESPGLNNRKAFKLPVKIIPLLGPLELIYIFAVDDPIVLVPLRDSAPLAISTPVEGELVPMPI